MRFNLTLAIGLIVLAVLFLIWKQHEQKLPSPEDTHTGILKGSYYDKDVR